MTYTYADVMAVLTEYLPDTPVIAADAFITALLDYTPDHPRDGFLRAGEKGSAAAMSFLRAFAAQDSDILESIKDKKIQAIKQLREATYCSLKEAKEAVESNEVMEASKDFWTAKELAES